jgi:hypothetical protein
MADQSTGAMENAREEKTSALTWMTTVLTPASAAARDARR